MLLVACFFGYNCIKLVERDYYYSDKFLRSFTSFYIYRLYVLALNISKSGICFFSHFHICRLDVLSFAHYYIFTLLHSLISTFAHFHIRSSSYLHICSSSHFHICSSSHLHICTFLLLRYKL